MRKFWIALGILSVAAVTAAHDLDYDSGTWPAWLDLDKDCQDAQQEALIRDAKEGSTKLSEDKCQVTAGVWLDFYTGQAVTDVKKLIADHVVPTANAHSNGAAAWTQEQREAFANDPVNLVLTTPEMVEMRAGRTPDEWMPQSMTGCLYIRRWIDVKSRFKLTMTVAEARRVFLLMIACSLTDTR